MSTDKPPLDPYTDMDIKRLIDTLEARLPWIIERIEFEKTDDETVAEWIRDAIQEGELSSSLSTPS